MFPDVWVMTNFRGTDCSNRSMVQSVAGKFRGKMLLDMVGVIIDDYDFLWDQYYFSTATL